MLITSIIGLQWLGWHEMHRVISLLAPGQIDWTRILGSRQVTDAYLLALAVKHEGRLVTFDKAAPLAAVAGAREPNLEVIAAR